MRNLLELIKVNRPHKEEVIELLNKLNKGCNGFKAYVAGGWLRDIDNGIDPKDADIFICPTQEEEIPHELVYDLTRNFKTETIRSFHPNYEGGQMREDVSYVIKCDVYDMVVMHTRIEETIRNFDVSICQIYGFVEDGEIKCVNTRQYDDYKLNNIIWQYDDIKTTDNHIERVKEKFPNTTFKTMSSEGVTFNNSTRDIWENSRV